MGEVLLSDVKGGGGLEDDEGDSLLGCCGGIIIGEGIALRVSWEWGMVTGNI